MRRQDRTRSLLILAAKIAGAVVVVVVIVIVRPFVYSGPSGATLDPYATGFKNPTFVGFAPGEPRRLYVVEQAGRIRFLLGRRIGDTSSTSGHGF